jgi:hypothetical protein
MEHLSFDIICRIADGDIKQDEMAVHLTHWNSCRSCQQEVKLQRSIVKISKQAQLISPSTDFAQNVLDAVIPSKKKRWYEWILHNLGNMIAMTSVLTFLGYIFSITENSPFQKDKPTTVGPILDFFKIIQDGSNQFVKYLTSKSHLQDIDTSQTSTIVFALLAIVLLVFIDQIADHFFRQSKV